MINTDFIKNFNGLALPDKLVKLLVFENNLAKNEYYANGFELIVEEKKYGLKTYSEDKQFLNSILEFAQADGSGSTYGFWLRNGTQNLNEAPVVIFGSEGGCHVVAENIDGLLQILTYDAEPLVSWEDVNYYRDDEGYEPSPLSNNFADWLFENFMLGQSIDANRIVKKAQAKYQGEFLVWLKKYYKG